MKNKLDKLFIVLLIGLIAGTIYGEIRKPNEPYVWYDEVGDTEYMLSPWGGITPRIDEGGYYFCRKCDSKRTDYKLTRR